MTGWLEFISHVPPYLMPAVIIVAVLFVLFYIGRAVWRAWPIIKQFVLTVNAITGLPEFMQRTDERFTALGNDLGRVRKQVENDHKTNFRDDLTDAQETAKRVERGVRSLHLKHAAATRSNNKRFDKLDAQIAELHAADAALRDDIENTQPHPTKGES